MLAFCFNCCLERSRVGRMEEWNHWPTRLVRRGGSPRINDSIVEVVLENIEYE